MAAKKQKAERLQIRVSAQTKNKWNEAVSRFAGSAENLLCSALDLLDVEIELSHSLERKIEGLVNSLNATTKLMLVNTKETKESLTLAHSRISDLEKTIDTISPMKKAFEDRESQLLGEIFELKEEVKLIQKVREELIKAKAENQALKRERLDLRKQLNSQ